MPRVTNTEHYRRHQFLQLLYGDPGLQVLYGLLSPEEQWRLHRYYQPSHSFTEIEYLAVRHQLDDTTPALVHQAGKHFRRIEDAFIALSRQMGLDDSQIRQAIAQAVATHAAAEQRSSLASEETAGARSGKSSTQPSRVITVPIVSAEPDAEKLARILLDLAERQTKKDAEGGS